MNIVVDLLKKNVVMVPVVASCNSSERLQGLSTSLDLTETINAKSSSN